jgi:peptidoglycan hydrolase-like amidase
LDRKSNFFGKQIYGLAGHRDVDNTNCPGDNLYSLFDKIRANAKALSLKYKKCAYQVSGETTIWIIENGRRKGFSSQEIMASQGYDSRKIVDISRKQLEAYSTGLLAGLLAKYPDGSLLQTINSPMVYLIEQGKKRVFEMTGEQFSHLGFEWPTIKKVSLEDLTAYSDGQKIKYGSDGELVTTKNSTVYLIENGKKRAFTSATLFNKLGYDWSKIKIIENEEMESFLSGKKMKYPDGTLIRGADKPTVYFLENGTLRKITSPTLFQISEFDWQEIITTAQDELNFYSLGENLSYPNSTLVKSKIQPSVYLIDKKNSKKVKREFTSAELFNHLNYDWSKIIEISQEELNLYPTEKPMLYKNGDLLQAENSSPVYLIENGKKRKIDSLGIFQAKNYQWNQVIVVSEREITFYPLDSPLKYPDSALIKKQGGNKIYLVKNGKGEWIQSAEEFKSAGYKWEDIVELSQEEFSRYVENSSADEIDLPRPAESEKLEENSQEENNQEETDEKNTGQENIQEPIIRIAICSVNEGENVSITANGAYDIQNANGLAAAKSANEISNVVYSQNAYSKFIPKNSGTILQIISYSNPNWNNTANYNQFRGSIEIKYSPVSKKLWVINELSFENYLKGMAETCQNDPEEYIKAMTLAARTYAYYHLNRGGKYGSDEIFHLKNSAADQLYKGYGREILTSDIAKAVDKTRGKIIIYNDSPIVSAYSSGAPELMTAGTKSACEVWNGGYCQSGYEYLAGGVKDPVGTSYNYDSCGGACHCVGLSGAGARQMANEGKTYQEILKHYYLGTEIQKKY